MTMKKGEENSAKDVTDLRKFLLCVSEWQSERVRKCKNVIHSKVESLSQMRSKNLNYNIKQNMCKVCINIMLVYHLR